MSASNENGKTQQYPCQLPEVLIRVVSTSRTAVQLVSGMISIDILVTEYDMSTRKKIGEEKGEKNNRIVAEELR